jgi:hypothetical protein
MPYSAGPNFGGSSDGYLLRLVTPGGFGTFGHGCSTTGAGLVADLGALPLRGTTWQTRVVSMLPAAPGLAAIDLVPQGGIALAPFGLPGCDLYVLPTILQLFVADGSGTGTVALAIPNVVALSGLEVFVQAACQEPAANPVGLAVTHAGMAMIR